MNIHIDMYVQLNSQILCQCDLATFRCVSQTKRGFKLDVYMAVSSAFG
jgi:hypothetical protein